MNRIQIETREVNLYYGQSRVLRDVTLDIPEKAVTALIGPSGCGKSSFLRCLNRMNDFIPSARVEGDILIDGSNIYESGTDVISLRRNVGMVFQKPNPFPMSIYDNVAYGPRLHGIRDRVKLDEIVRNSLTGAALWDEVKDKLKTPGTGLSGGQDLRHDGVFPPGRPRGVRQYSEDVHISRRQAYGRLHHGAVRLEAERSERT